MLHAEEKIMQQIEKPSRTIPVMAETDVLVVGRGPSGLATALASVRESVQINYSIATRFIGKKLTI